MSAVIGSSSLRTGGREGVLWTSNLLEAKNSRFFENYDVFAPTREFGQCGQEGQFFAILCGRSCPLRTAPNLNSSRSANRQVIEANQI